MCGISYLFIIFTNVFLPVFKTPYNCYVNFNAYKYIIMLKYIHHVFSYFVNTTVPVPDTVQKICKVNFVHALVGLDFFLFMYIIQHCFICRLSDFTESEDAEIEHRTVATMRLTAKLSNHSARSHPLVLLIKNAV
jgi:hypothetical protein